MLTHRMDSGAAVNGGGGLGADLDGDDLSTVVMPTLGAGSVRLIAEVVTHCGQLFNCGAFRVMFFARRLRTRLLDDLPFGTAIK